MSSVVSTSASAARAGQDAVRYACERCKTESVLAPTPSSLGRGGRLHAHFLIIVRTIGPHEGPRQTLAQVAAGLLARAEDDAYRTFTSRFRFCHECRRFVCPSCWSRSWRCCKSCVARAMKAMSPRRRHFRFGLSLTVIAASLLLLAVGFGSLLLR
jgi:hypothetical protein